MFVWLLVESHARSFTTTEGWWGAYGKRRTGKGKENWRGKNQERRRGKSSDNVAILGIR